MKIRVWGILILVCIGGLVSGADQASFRTTTLENGMDIVVIENHTVPLATIEIVVKNGAYTEPPEYDGLSHLYEHMFFKANKKIPGQEAYMDRARELGMVWNGTTSEERVNYFFTLPADSLRAGMEFMKNAIRYPLFLKKEMEKENHVVNGEFDRNEASPFFQVFRAMNKQLWTEYFSRKNAIGNREIILTATPEKMRTIQRRYYIPNNSALIVAGDVDADKVNTLAKNMYHDWERGADPFEEYPVPEHPPLSANLDTIVTKPVNVSMLMVGWQGPKALDDVQSTFAADVFSFILSQKTSAFQKNLVDSGIALQAEVSYYTLQHTGPITARIVTPPNNILKAHKVFMAEVEKFTDPEYFTDQQLETAKNLLEVDAIYAREKASSYAHTVSFWWAITGLDYYRNYFDKLRSVTRQDIVNYVNTYIKGKPHVVAALVSLMSGNLYN